MAYELNSLVCMGIIHGHMRAVVDCRADIDPTGMDPCSVIVRCPFLSSQPHHRTGVTLAFLTGFSDSLSVP